MAIYSFYKNRKLEDLPTETWVPIIGYEESYMVSSLGRVKSIDRIIDHGIKGKRLWKGIMLKQEDVKGYLLVTLGKNSTKKKLQVHRLVAISFIPNPDNKPCVNHLNSTPKDNRAVNLDWCTISENAKYAFMQGLRMTKNEERSDCKVPSAIIREIRELNEAGSFTQREIAKKINLDYRYVNQVVNYKIRLFA